MQYLDAARLDAIDQALINPKGAPPDLAKQTMGELGRLRTAAAQELESHEARWMEASEELEVAEENFA